MRVNFVIRLLCVVAVSLLAAGCGGPERTEKLPDPGQIEAGEPVDGGWLITRMGNEPENLNPYTSSDAYATAILGLVFDSLLERDNETLRLEPHLAESYEVAEDHLAYTFKLRQDATFSDGEPVTAADVKFSFDKIKDPKVDAPHLRNYYKDVTGCKVVDEHTVRFACSKPYFRHLVMLGGFEILPKHVYGEGDFNKHPNNRHPIGSGPYVFEEWDTGRQIVLVRNDDYWNADKKPHILERVFKIITDDNAAFQVLQRRELDVMNLQPEQWVHRTDSKTFKEAFNKISYYRPYYNYIGWNCMRPMFRDKKVRQAMTMLLDRETIRETIFYGLAKAVTGNFFLETREYNKEVEPWPFDPDAAKETLDEAGWVDSDKDGVREKDGVKFEFELLFPNASPTAEQIATVFQEELDRAGIEITLRPLAWATFLQNVDERKFDAVILGWSMPLDPDPYQVWHSSQVKKGSNHVGFENDEADKLIEDARTTFDRDERIKLYHRFHEILHEEQPYTFMFCSKVLMAVNKRFQDVNVYAMGPDTLEWWVPKPLQRYP